MATDLRVRCRFSDFLRFAETDKTLQGGSDPPPLGPQNGGWYGACYNQFWATTGPLIPKNFNRFAALNSAQFQLIGPSVVCGTCLMITYPTLGTKTMVQIVDSCPGCPVNGVDVAHSAFARLFDSPALPGIDTWTEAETVGALPAVTWQVVSCDTLVADTTFLVDKVAADAVIAAKALLAGRKLRRADGAEGEL
ncbi:hypothetical protein HKX48_002965 [Thoreauomyces humboldtii]|nr:hypothetical protein HKX48_002965 [Thoreauomyces humboldtii]